MFHSIRGILLEKDSGTAVIDIQGLAYELLIPENVSDQLPPPGEEALLYTKLIVRENEQYLIGFASLTDKRLYENLITVSGIGPRQGLKILSHLSATEIRNAIVNGDSRTLSRVKGIGARTAERIILELRDKMAAFVTADLPQGGTSSDKKKMEVLMALRVLGYNDGEARRVLDVIKDDFQELLQGSVEDIIKKALALLSSR